MLHQSYRSITSLLFLTSCLVHAQQQQHSLDSHTAAAEAVAKANTLFTSDFYSVLKNDYPNQNLIFSPYSLSACVGMLKAGAAGVTAKEIQNGMRFPADETLFKGYQAQLNSLRSNENFTLETANSVYTKRGFRLDERFKSIVGQNFGAQVEQLDFNEGVGSARIINGFVERVTRDKIKDLISPDDLDANTRLVLVNAIYFKGLWKNKFDEQQTTKEEFHVTPTQSVQVDMMQITAEFPYGTIPELDATALALPYKGDRLSMIVILPNKQNGLAELETKLKTFNLGLIQSKLQSRKVQLSMPKFKLESEIDLKQPLEALGMKSMFDDQSADLSGIPDKSNPQPLYVSKAIQKAFLEVNEEGSEAAAATAFEASARSGLPISPPEFIVDHPFIAFISQEQEAESTYDVLADNYHVSTLPEPTSVVLFFSSVHDPSRHRTARLFRDSNTGTVATASASAFFMGLLTVAAACVLRH